VHGREEGNAKVALSGVAISKVEKFKYLSSIIQEKGDIYEYINKHIKVE